MKLMRHFESEEYDEPYYDEHGNMVRRLYLYNEKNERPEVGEAINIEGRIFKVIGNYNKFCDCQLIFS